MTTEITEPTAQVSVPDVPRIDELVATAEALAELARMFGHLPKPYVTFPSSSVRIDLHVKSPSAFEAWRTALQMAPDGVSLHSYQGGVWLAASGVFRGVPVELTGDVDLSAEVVTGKTAVAA